MGFSTFYFNNTFFYWETCYRGLSKLIQLLTFILYNQNKWNNNESHFHFFKIFNVYHPYYFKHNILIHICM